MAPIYQDRDWRPLACGLPGRAFRETGRRINLSQGKARLRPNEVTLCSMKNHGTVEPLEKRELIGRVPLKETFVGPIDYATPKTVEEARAARRQRRPDNRATRRLPDRPDHGRPAVRLRGPPLSGHGPWAFDDLWLRQTDRWPSSHL